MWQLSEGEQYRDSNSRIWEIQHHLMIRGVEELLLRLMPVLWICPRRIPARNKPVKYRNACKPTTIWRLDVRLCSKR
ncbi:unnamed protein product [Caretta caretta]